MKAAIVTGPDQSPICADFDDPIAEDGQAIVKLVAAGIHNVVRSRASGAHYSASGVWPLVPGIDAVARTADGDLVYTGHVRAPWGTMAEQMAVPARFMLPIPVGVDPLAAAAGCNPGLASWLPLSAQADRRVESGGLGAILILGTTGMAGKIAVDNALALGATRIVGAGRNRAVLDDLADAHGDRFRAVALTGTDSDSDAIREAFDGRAPSTVIDFVWGPVAERTFVALAPLCEYSEVAHVEVGALAGSDARVPAALLRSRQYTLSGSGLGSVSAEAIANGIDDFLKLVRTGAVTIPYVAYPLSAVEKAWAFTGPERAVVVPG